MFGELHGTREVPQLIGGLLAELARLGYGGLALEAPHDLRGPLQAWADGSVLDPPRFYARPNRDGRGNIQMLELIRSARSLGLELLCFDQSVGQPAQSWADRDRWMARNLLEQWAALEAGTRVLGICGSQHVRLVDEHGVGGLLRQAASGGERHWPSLAGWIRQWQPGVAISSIDVRFASGAFYNMGKRTIYARPGASREPWLRDGASGVTAELWLPRATVATFLAAPS